MIAGQPVLPLLAYQWINGATGWALVLAAVAAIDLVLARAFTRDGRLVAPPPPAPRRPGTSRTGPAILDDAPPAGAPPQRRTADDDSDAGLDRPESAPEEADAVLTVPGGQRDGRTRAVREPQQPDPPRPARTAAWTASATTVPSTPWLRELTWALHGVTVGAALLYAVIALVGTETVPGAFRAGVVLVLAAAIGLAGALMIGRAPLPALAAGILTLAVIGAAGRIAAVALPGRALLLIALVVALTGLGVRAVPATARRGPQLASAVALVVIGVVVAGGALRAAVAPVRAALPVWRADLTGTRDARRHGRPDHLATRRDRVPAHRRRGARPAGGGPPRVRRHRRRADRARRPGLVRPALDDGPLAAGGHRDRHRHRRPLRRHRPGRAGARGRGGGGRTRRGREPRRRGPASPPPCCSPWPSPGC